MQVSIVVAAAENGTIGAEGDIPWKLPDDQRRFKALTLGHTLVMGRRTFESIGRILPGRRSIVLSSDPSYGIDGADVAGSLEAALALARSAGETETFVVGGEAVYRTALEIADRVHLTRVLASVPGDTHFPDDQELTRQGFALAESEPHPTDERHAHAFRFERWERRAS